MRKKQLTRQHDGANTLRAVVNFLNSRSEFQNDNKTMTRLLLDYKEYTEKMKGTRP